MGSIKSPIKFETYKVDHISYEMKKTIQLLASTGNVDPNAWELSISIGKPLFFSKHNKYISSLKAGLCLMPDAVAQEQEEAEANDVDSEPLLQCNVNISGIFSVEDGRLDKDVEMNLIKLHLPSILLPYARSTITSILANAGFGSVILPLINLHEVAKNSEKELDIQVID